LKGEENAKEGRACGETVQRWAEKVQVPALGQRVVHRLEALVEGLWMEQEGLDWRRKLVGKRSWQVQTMALWTPLENPRKKGVSPLLRHAFQWDPRRSFVPLQQQDHAPG